MYPSIGNGCLKDGGNVLATAISVAGPATIPLPGPKPGQTAYVFTAIGTPGPAAEQKLPLNATRVSRGLLDDRAQVLHRRQAGCLQVVDRQRCRVGIGDGAAEQQQGGGPDRGGGAEHHFQGLTR